MKEIFALALIILNIATGCSYDTTVKEVKVENEVSMYKTITPKEAYEKMQNLEDYIILDVRTEEEYSEKHIEGSILIPDTEILARAQSELPDKNKVILIYCRSGRRSALAANDLIKLGYTNVYDFGGIIDWPYETVELGNY